MTDDENRRLLEDTLKAAQAVESMARARQTGSASSANGNIVRLEGAGSVWNGIAIGIALGAVILGTGWISTNLQKMDVRSQQAEAYHKAVYMLAPRFAEEIDKELTRQKERESNEQPNPDHHQAAD